MGAEHRTESAIREEIAAERAELAEAVAALRADVRSKRRPLARQLVGLSAVAAALLAWRVGRRLRRGRG